MVVLVVDDDRDTRVILRTMLEASGYEVHEAADGPQALQTARSVHPDVVIMDVWIPRMDGWQVTRALRRDSVTSHIPVVAISADALPEHEERAREVGCVGFLAKPIEPSVILEEVDWILRSGIPA